MLKRTLANFPAMTIEQARLLAGEVNAALNKGVDPLDEKRALRAEATLAEVFEQYLNCYAREHCKTWQVIEYNFNHYLKDWWNRRVRSIRKQEVQKLHSELGKNCGATTANRIIELLKAVINKGISWGLTDCKNPSVGIEKFKLKARDRFVKAHELPRLIAAIEEEPNRDVRDFVMLALSTGARKSNIVQMRWRDVDLEGGTWVIPETKNGTSQTILLTPEELKLLRERFNCRRSFEWVFAGSVAKGHLDDP
ncbi:MAG TPA: tyrosine-type recombinase/integrase, partial [Candidatus Obscuribacterales bacterium]